MRETAKGWRVPPGRANNDNTTNDDDDGSHNNNSSSSNNDGDKSKTKTITEKKVWQYLRR